VAVVAAIPEAADSVRVLLPVPGAAMAVGERLTVTPLGAPVTDKDIGELNRYKAAVDRVTCVDAAATTLTLVELGVSVSVKVGERTVRLRV
jgi:hypothetical protein